MTLRPTGWVDGHTLPAQLRELIGCTGAGSPLGCTIVKDTKARHSEVTLGCPGPGSTPVRVLAAWGGGCLTGGWAGSQPKGPPPCASASSPGQKPASLSCLCFLLGASGRPSRQKSFASRPQDCRPQPWRALSGPGGGRLVDSGDGRRTLALSPTLSLAGMSPLWDGDQGLGQLLGRQPEAPRLPARPEALGAKSGPSPLGTANNRPPPSPSCQQGSQVASFTLACPCSRP